MMSVASVIGGEKSAHDDECHEAVVVAQDTHLFSEKYMRVYPLLQF